MIDIKSILKTFGLFVLLFSGLLGFASLEPIEERTGQWFIKSTSRLFEWTMPQASINVEHDRNAQKYNPNEVWISPVSKAWLNEQIMEAQRTRKPLEVDNAASLLFKVGTFPKTSLIFLLALVLATPLSWKKKLRALFISLLAFMVYFYLFIYFDIIHHISVSRIGVYELEGTAMSIVRFFKKTFCNFGFSLTFAMLVWAVTCIDFNAFLNKFNLALQGNTPSTASTSRPKRKKSKKKKSK